MTRERAKELLPIIQAFAEGKATQFSIDDGHSWRDNNTEYHTLNFIFDGSVLYRVKPEPKTVWIYTDDLKRDRASIASSEPRPNPSGIWKKFIEVIA